MITVTIFAMLFAIGSAVASLVTEAIKKVYSNVNKECSPNFVALVVAFVVGCLGMIAAYILLDIPFDAKSIICIALMTLAIWVGAMLGYDKVRQLFEQISPR